MAHTPFLAALQAALFPDGPVTTRRMFGGTGYYVEGRIFALEFDGALYLKADAESKPRFAAAGLAPFTYIGAHGKEIAIAYHRAPEPLDDPTALAPWLQLALGAARRAEGKKRKKS